MKDKELKLNGSGYYDEPCYQTIKNVDAPKPGEIYIHGDTGRYVLVLNCVNGVCAILNLTEQERENRIPVMARVKMYTNPIMINYTFTTTLRQYVKTITDEECLEVKKAVCDALGLKGIAIPAVPHDHINALERRNAELLEERDKMLETAGHAHGEMIKMTDERDKAEKNWNEAIREVNALNAANAELSKALEKEYVKSQFYREMYDTLLDKVISARGGSVNE